MPHTVPVFIKVQLLSASLCPPPPHPQLKPLPTPHSNLSLPYPCPCPCSNLCPALPLPLAYQNVVDWAKPLYFAPALRT